MTFSGSVHADKFAWSVFVRGPKGESHGRKEQPRVFFTAFCTYSPLHCSRWLKVKRAVRMYVVKPGRNHGKPELIK